MLVQLFSFFLVAATNGGVEPLISRAMRDASSINADQGVASSKSKKMHEIYDDVAIDSNLREASDGDIRGAFRVARMAYFYSNYSNYSFREKYLSDMERYYDELSNRNVVSGSELSDLYESLIVARKFDAAKEILDRHKYDDLPEIPNVSAQKDFNDSKPALYQLSSERHGLVLRNIDIGSRDLLVIVAHCHFSEDAARAIYKDGELSKAFSDAHAIWLSSASESLDLSQLSQWADKFPEHPITIAYDNAAWPGVDFSISPTFYLFRDGKVVLKHVGWSEQRGVDALKKMLRH